MLNFLFGPGRKIRKLRRRWDRLREKALKRKGLIKKIALERLDNIENNLRVLEERRLNRMEMARISKDIEISISEIAALIKMKPEEFDAYNKRVQPGYKIS